MIIAGASFTGLAAANALETDLGILYHMGNSLYWVPRPQSSSAALKGRLPGMEVCSIMVYLETLPVFNLIPFLV